MTDTAPLPPQGPSTDPPGSDTRHGSLPRSGGPFTGSPSGRVLRRSTSDRQVAGVAGGLGRWLDVDPTVLRVLFVVLTFFGGAGLLFYAVAWLLVPEEGSERAAVPIGETVRNAALIGAVVVAAMVVLGTGSLDGRFFGWPLLVVGLVLAMVLLGRDSRRGVAPAPPGPPGRPGPLPPPPAHGPGSPAATGTEGTVVLEKQSAWYPPAAPPPSPPPRRTGPLLLGPALALLAMGLGLLGLYDTTGGEVAAAAYPALALALVGLLLVVGAFVGRPGGLVLLGVLAGLALLPTALVDPTYSGPRELTVRPTSGADLDAAYHVPAGRIELDLHAVGDPSSLDGRTIDLSVGAGEVLVLVPREVRVDYDAAVDLGGQVDAFGRSAAGWSPALSGEVGPADPDATVTLVLAADLGELRMVRS